MTLLLLIIGSLIFLVTPLVWSRGAAAAPNCAHDALLGSRNSDPNDRNRRQYHPLHQDRERTNPRPAAHA